MVGGWLGKHIMVKRVISITLLFAFVTSFVLRDAWAAVDIGDAPYEMSEQKLAQFARLDTETFTLPAHLGDVEYSFKGDSDKVVIHIQDAHCNSFAQNKISDIIDYLNEEYGISMVNLEGGVGGYDFTVFTSITGEAIRREVANHFVKTGEINGAEFYAIDNPGKVTLWGVEDKDLYLENLKVYRGSLAYQEEADRFMKELTHILNNLKRHIYTPELLKIDMAYNAYKAGNMDFREYVEFLIKKARERAIQVRQFANLYLLVQAMELEDKIDFKKANTQRNIIVDELKKDLSPKDVRELVSKSVDFKTKKISRKTFYDYLLGKARELRIDIGRFPALSSYIVYISLYEAVNRYEVMEELDEFEAKLKEPLYTSDTQRRLNTLSRNLALTKNIFAISLTKTDYRYYLDNKSSFDVNDYLKFIQEEAPKYKISARPSADILKLNDYREDIAKFYEYSFKRDEVFLQNLRFGRVKEETEGAVLMTGGFHTENLCELFKAEGISYVSITPKFVCAKEYESPYFDLLAGQTTDIHQMLRSVLAEAAMLAWYAQLNPELAEYINNYYNLKGEDHNLDVRVRIWERIMQRMWKPELDENGNKRSTGVTTVVIMDGDRVLHVEGDKEGRNKKEIQIAKLLEEVGVRVPGVEVAGTGQVVIPTDTGLTVQMEIDSLLRDIENNLERMQNMQPVEIMSFMRMLIEKNRSLMNRELLLSTQRYFERARMRLDAVSFSYDQQLAEGVNQFLNYGEGDPVDILSEHVPELKLIFDERMSEVSTEYAAHPTTLTFGNRVRGSFSIMEPQLNMSGLYEIDGIRIRAVLRILFALENIGGVPAYLFENGDARVMELLVNLGIDPKKLKGDFGEDRIYLNKAILLVVMKKLGFNKKEVTLAANLVNHEIIFNFLMHKARGIDYDKKLDNSIAKHITKLAVKCGISEHLLIRLGYLLQTVNSAFEVDDHREIKQENGIYMPAIDHAELGLVQFSELASVRPHSAGVIPGEFSALNSELSKVAQELRKRKALSQVSQEKDFFRQDGSINPNGIVLVHAAKGLTEDGRLYPNSYFGDKNPLLRTPRNIVEFAWNGVIDQWNKEDIVVMVPFNLVEKSNFMNLWYTASSHFGPFTLPAGTTILVRKGAKLPDKVLVSLKQKGIHIKEFGVNEPASMASERVLTQAGYRAFQLKTPRLLDSMGWGTTFRDKVSNIDYSLQEHSLVMERSKDRLVGELGINSANETGGYPVGALTLLLERLFDNLSQRGIISGGGYYKGDIIETLESFFMEAKNSLTQQQRESESWERTRNYVEAFLEIAKVQKDIKNIFGMDFNKLYGGLYDGFKYKHQAGQKEKLSMMVQYLNVNYNLNVDVNTIRNPKDLALLMTRVFDAISPGITSRIARFDELERKPAAAEPVLVGTAVLDLSRRVAKYLRLGSDAEAVAVAPVGEESIFRVLLPYVTTGIFALLGIGGPHLMIVFRVSQIVFGTVFTWLHFRGKTDLLSIVRAGFIPLLVTVVNGVILAPLAFVNPLAFIGLSIFIHAFANWATLRINEIFPTLKLGLATIAPGAVVEAEPKLIKLGLSANATDFSSDATFFEDVANKLAAAGVPLGLTDKEGKTAEDAVKAARVHAAEARNAAKTGDGDVDEAAKAAIAAAESVAELAVALRFAEAVYIRRLKVFAGAAKTADSVEVARMHLLDAVEVAKQAGENIPLIIEGMNNRAAEATKDIENILKEEAKKEARAVGVTDLTGTALEIRQRTAEAIAAKAAPKAEAELAASKLFRDAFKLFRVGTAVLPEVEEWAERNIWTHMQWMPKWVRAVVNKKFANFAVIAPGWEELIYRILGPSLGLAAGTIFIGSLVGLQLPLLFAFGFSQLVFVAIFTASHYRGWKKILTAGGGWKGFLSGEGREKMVSALRTEWPVMWRATLVPLIVGLVNAAVVTLLFANLLSLLPFMGLAISVPLLVSNPLVNFLLLSFITTFSMHSATNLFVHFIANPLLDWFFPGFQLGLATIAPGAVAVPGVEKEVKRPESAPVELTQDERERRFLMLRFIGHAVFVNLDKISDARQLLQSLSFSYEKIKMIKGTAAMMEEARSILKLFSDELAGHLGREKTPIEQLDDKTLEAANEYFKRMQAFFVTYKENLVLLHSLANQRVLDNENAPALAKKEITEAGGAEALARNVIAEFTDLFVAANMSIRGDYDSGSYETMNEERLLRFLDAKNISEDQDTGASYLRNLAIMGAKKGAKNGLLIDIDPDINIRIPKGSAILLFIAIETAIQNAAAQLKKKGIKNPKIWLRVKRVGSEAVIEVEDNAGGYPVDEAGKPLLKPGDLFEVGVSTSGGRDRRTTGKEIY
ncbi:hypothetical protein ACFL5Y_01200 [Candidatus Omnitrophota bacterium]